MTNKKRCLSIDHRRRRHGKSCCACSTFSSFVPFFFPVSFTVNSVYPYRSPHKCQPAAAADQKNAAAVAAQSVPLSFCRYLKPSVSVVCPPIFS